MLALLLAALALILPARAADLPPELEPWVGWVLEGHPELRCPVLDGAAACLWPGQLRLDAGAQGATLALELTADRLIVVPLPGGRGAWPQGVTVDGAPAAVLDIGGPEAPIPAVTVAPGAHRIGGRYQWSAMPQGIAVPPIVGRVALSVDGRAVERPRIDAGGTLRLGEGEASTTRESRLELDVSRKIHDGVPLRVTTRVAVWASGSGREVDLGQVLLPGTRPVSLEADLPARFTGEGALVIQVRPGAFTIAFDALHDGPVSALSRPSSQLPWPEREAWAVAADDRSRAVNLSGPLAVDPARTTLPEAWRGLPTFLVEQGQPLDFEELRRGEPEPAPNQLTLYRQIWLDSDGQGLTVQDHFSGSMDQGWRLQSLAPLALGHAADGGTDLVITTSGGGAGVELRSRAVDLVAESRVEGRQRRLNAVGWDADVTRLSATLNLPPGWTLLDATGVDSLSGSVLDEWSLFDLFFVLVLGLATGRLVGWRWGAVALAGLALSRQAGGAPEWTWAWLLVAVALGRAAARGWAATAARWARWGLVAALFVMLLPFSIDQVQQGLFPALSQPWQQAGGDFSLAPPPPPPPIDAGAVDEDSRADDWEQAPQAAEHPGETAARLENSAYDGKTIDLLSRSSGGARGGQWQGKKKVEEYLSLQVDPTAVVQTGPGVPVWSWRSWPLEWSGPVTRDHEIRLLLLGPGANLALALARVMLLLALALKLSGIRQATVLPRGAPAIALLLAVSAPQASAGAPSPALLSELESRLTQPPDCLPRCATVSRLDVRVVDGALTLEAEVHAGAATAWPVPGPTGVWVPARVTVDGAETAAMARRADGFLMVRLEPGVHRVRATGALPPTDALTLQLGLQPQTLSFQGAGWTLAGLRADGTSERSVQLVRAMAAEGAGADARSSENLAPWLEVRRTLDLGLPWRVRTEVNRVGPASSPLTLSVPLLPGESVTEEGVEVRDGAVLVALDQDQAAVSWLSTLEESEALVLNAPQGVPWSEQWSVSCSPIFACAQEATAQGLLPPLVHVQEGRWSPLWRPWPGESIALRVQRPDAAPGRTLTVDRAHLDLTPGRRMSEATLTLSVRASQGGQQVVTLPDGARLQSVTLDGRALPVQALDGAVALPVQPGARRFAVSWQQSHEPSLIEGAPAVDLGAPAVNVSVRIRPPEERWTVALLGPRWGPVPLFWVYVLLVAAAAPLLARLPWAPLRAWEWALLGLGMTQVPAVAPVVVAGWFVAVGLRERRAPLVWWRFNLAQLALVGLTLAALGCLYAAIHAGLLFQPDMQIEGNGSTATELNWFVDRVDGAMPQPSVISLPMWVWRVGMLLWSLWLAASLVRWLPWAWRAWSGGGIFRGSPGSAKKKISEE